MSKDKEKPIKTICCVCKRVITEGDTIDGMVSHGYCKRCFDRIIKVEGMEP